MNIGRGWSLSKVGVEMNSLGQGFLLAFSQCSSSIDKRHRLGTHVDLGLSRHGSVADIGSGRIRGIGIHIVDWGLGFGGSRNEVGRGRHDFVINQRRDLGWGVGSSATLSMMRDMTHVGRLSCSAWLSRGKGKSTHLVDLAITMNISFFLINLVWIGPLQGSSKYIKDTAHDGSSISDSDNNEVERESDEFDG
jgi:hypothetical protein